MALDIKFLETEIEKAKATIQELEKGLELNKLVKKAFEEELQRLK